MRLSDLGVSYNLASKVQMVADVPEPWFEQALADQREPSAKPATRWCLLKPIIREQRRKRAAAEAMQAPERATIVTADAVKWLASLRAHSADLLLTDPPYSTDVPDIEAFVGSWLYQALRAVKPTGVAYVCIGSYPAELYAYLAQALSVDCPMPLADMLVWTYRNTMGPLPKNGYKRSRRLSMSENGPAPGEKIFFDGVNPRDGNHFDAAWWSLLRRNGVDVKVIAPHVVLPAAEAAS
ncbi:MAG: hypothetical protein ACYDCP_07010 [Thermoplasmataceae archaeon]